MPPKLLGVKILGFRTHIQIYYFLGHLTVDSGQRVVLQATSFGEVTNHITSDLASQQLLGWTVWYLLVQRQSTTQYQLLQNKGELLLSGSTCGLQGGIWLFTVCHRILN